MSYTLSSNNGSITIPVQTTDTSSTPLALTGKNAIDWGKDYAQNFLSLLENFSGSTSPSHPRTGILWYDTATSTLKVYGGSSWSSVATAATTATQLATPRTIRITGIISGSASFNGTADANIAISSLNATGVTAGNYLSANLTIGADGRIISASSGLTGNDVSTPVTSFNTRIGNITLTSGDVTTALGFTPANSSSALTSINGTQVTNALGYTPANDSLVVHKSGDTMTGTLNLNSNRITGLPVPNSGDQPVRKNEYDGLATTVAGKTVRNYNGSVSTSYNVTVSSAAPSGGSDGDVWYRY